MKAIYSFLALLVLSAAAQAQVCNNYWAEISPDGNTLYFSSDRHGGDYEIYRSDLDGISNLERLTYLPGNDVKPRISPDGNKIVFQNGDYASGAEIYIMDIDGSNLMPLTSNSVYDGSPSFSPDGETIIFTAWDDFQYPEIFTMNVDGSARTQLTNVPGAYWQSDGVFNPAGDKIYFLEGFNADNHIVRMDLDGSNWVDITPDNSFGYSEASIAFSPDGSKMIFFTTENQGYNNGGDLVIADIDGSNWNFLTNSVNGDYFSQAVFHPTNDKLYYSKYIAGVNYEIHRMDTTGENSVLISNCSLVGIGERPEVAHFDIYPNPATDVVSLRLDATDAAYLQVFSTNGKLIVEQALPAAVGNVQLDVADWPAGIYLMKIQTSETAGAQKLIISR
jgi:TolB protein